MKSGSCPKCGSKEIYTNSEGYHGLESSRLGVSGFKTYTVDHYVCSNCRYVELFLNDRWDIEFIKKKWKKI